MCSKTNKRTPHPHADVIHAWADGAEIQWRDPNKYRGIESSDWRDCGEEGPQWYTVLEYRIKPEQSDLEKYGVEVGDVWCIDSEMKTVRCVTPDTVYTGGSSVKFTDIRLTLGIGSERFNRLLFRRGVVNKL